MCSFLVWKKSCLNYREFDLEGDLVGVPHSWYISAQSFIRLFILVWREYDIVAMNEWKKKCVGLQRTWVSKRTVVHSQGWLKLSYRTSTPPVSKQKPYSLAEHCLLIICRGLLFQIKTMTVRIVCVGGGRRIPLFYLFFLNIHGFIFFGSTRWPPLKIGYTLAVIQYFGNRPESSKVWKMFEIGCLISSTDSIKRTGGMPSGPGDLSFLGTLKSFSVAS